MSINDQDIELFESYLSDGLQDQERAAFESRLAVDESFAEDFQLYKSSVKATKITGFMSEVEEVMQQKKKEEAKNPVNYRWLFVAASVSVIALFYFLFYPQSSNEQLSFNDLYKPYPNILQKRSEKLTLLNDALEAYSIGNYEKASTKFAEINPKSDTIYFYKGLCAISLGKFDDAMADFNQVETEKSAFKNQLYWYQALIFLKKDQKVQGKSNLQKIDSKSKYYELAQQLINQLSE